MTELLIGTSSGMFAVNGAGIEADDAFGSRSVTALAASRGTVYAIADRRTLLRREADRSWTDLAESVELELECVLATRTSVFAGTEEAHLFRLDDSELVWVESFESVDGRDDWYTPWGGPPAVRSMAADLGGRLHANVHVGGIPRSEDGERWEPTIEIDADVHQVIAHPDEPDIVLAAGAVGLCVSVDGGATWRIEGDGLHSSYSRAVAVAGDTVLVTACTGPHGGRGAVYRTSLGAGAGFEKCTDGLPEWFDGNIDSGWVAASGSDVAFGTPDGEVYRSADAGQRWERVAQGLSSIRWLCLA